MASTNFITLKTHLSEFKSNSDKDTISEVSEGGTSNSITSAEELQKFALILGLNSVEDVYQERFRVDRRRLETMLADNLEESQTAQAFFHRVMNDTNTLIKWPTRLKIGARSKKDPHVRVAGKQDNVKMAREKIMQLLDTRSNRVTMKIDVSYTDHSHIIGKSGLTIKRVMEETGCHIHFPDSNRTSTIEKSNQVSIAGDMERVERARARVRALTPLVFSFELPIASASQPLPDINSPYVQQIQEQYNVQVKIRSRQKLHAQLLMVKGVQWEVQTTMEATTLLINYMCGSYASQTLVHMSLEISPIHQSLVIGRNAEQLRLIMKGTNTQIMFPDANDPYIPPIKKSSVTISGLINDVYSARQQIIGCLPLVVIFDVPSDSYQIENDLATRLMQKHNVYINVRHKPKHGIISVLIKGIERCAGDIYEARRKLLGEKEPVVTAEIPESYNIPSITNSIPITNLFNPFSPSHTTTMPPLNSPMNNSYTLNDLVNFTSPMYNQSPISPVALTPVYSNTWLIPSPQPNHQFNQPGFPMVYGNNQGWNPMSNGMDPGMQQSMAQQYPQHNEQPKPTAGLLNVSSHTSSGYQSNFTGSCVSLDVHNQSAGSNMVTPSISPISKNQTPSPSNDNTRTPTDLTNLIPDLKISDRRAVGCEKKTLEVLTKKLSPLSEYRQLEADANKAMQETVGSGYRVPTSRWAGRFFSRTSPAPINLAENTTNEMTAEDSWNRPELHRPNIVEKLSPAKDEYKQCSYQLLQDLLQKHGLNKYIEMFKKHELDIATFASLTDDDLREIGVSAFGARRKMMIVIRDLQKQNACHLASYGSENTAASMSHNNDSKKDKW